MSPEEITNLLHRAYHKDDHRAHARLAGVAVTRPLTALPVLDAPAPLLRLTDGRVEAMPEAPPMTDRGNPAYAVAYERTQRLLSVTAEQKKRQAIHAYMKILTAGSKTQTIGSRTTITFCDGSVFSLPPVKPIVQQVLSL